MSMTFHNVRYMAMSSPTLVQHRDKMTAYALAMRNYPYPLGWSSTVASNHDNYDLATIMRVAWDKTPAHVRPGATAALEEMLAWATGPQAVAKGADNTVS